MEELKQKRDLKWLEDLMEKPTSSENEIAEKDTENEVMLLNRTPKRSKNKEKETENEIKMADETKAYPKLEVCDKSENKENRYEIPRMSG